MKIKIWVFKLPNKQRNGYTKYKEENERINNMENKNEETGTINKSTNNKKASFLPMFPYRNSHAVPGTSSNVNVRKSEDYSDLSQRKDLLPHRREEKSLVLTVQNLQTQKTSHCYGLTR